MSRGEFRSAAGIRRPRGRVVRAFLRSGGAKRGCCRRFFIYYIYGAKNPTSINTMKIGIISAMYEEFDRLLQAVEVSKKTVLGRREYIEGRLFGRDVVLVFSQWGKTAAASTTANLINLFGIDRLVFTGVAGGLDVRARIGDIVVAERLYHHDVDASPFKPRYFVPLVGPDGIAADAETSQALAEAAQRFAGRIDRYIAQEDIQAFSLQSVSVHRKNIATGDQFVKTAEVKDRITTDLPDMFCVEMEGAAVAQVCWEHGVPFAVMRTISDTADGDSPSDYPKFLNRVASTYSFYIVKEFFAALS